MYLTEDQSPSTKGHLSMVRHNITICKFVRWLFLEFVLSEFLIVLHWWSFKKSDLLRFGVRSLCSGYRSFCNLVCLYYFQLFISWLRLLIFITITVRSSILICSMNIVCSAKLYFLPYPPPIEGLILLRNPPSDRMFTATYWCIADNTCIYFNPVILVVFFSDWTVCCWLSGGPWASSFSFSSATAERILSKLDREQVLNVQATGFVWSQSLPLDGL